MIRRFVLDGPPGAGKSTLLHGMSDGTGDAVSATTMQSLGYNCFHESVAESNERLRSRALDPEIEKELWLETIVDIDRDKFSAAADGVNFFDRCFHHWKVLSEGAGISLPGWYDEFNISIRYDDPVFLISPIRSIDLDRSSIPASRRYPWHRRMENHAHIKRMYDGLGYSVVEIPVFFEGDIERNSQARIRRILDVIGL